MILYFIYSIILKYCTYSLSTSYPLKRDLDSHLLQVHDRPETSKSGCTISSEDGDAQDADDYEEDMHMYSVPCWPGDPMAQKLQASSARSRDDSRYRQKVGTIYTLVLTHRHHKRNRYNCRLHAGAHPVQHGANKLIKSFTV